MDSFSVKNLNTLSQTLWTLEIDNSGIIHRMHDGSLYHRAVVDHRVHSV